MTQKPYHESLQKLHTELKNAKTAPKKEISAEEIAALEKLNESVLNILEHPGEVPFVEHHNLLSDLKDNVLRFEARHPALSTAMSNVIHTLSNMGI